MTDDGVTAGVSVPGAETRPLPVSDPRVFFAAERTLLAWVRSGITIIALGFVVSRFGLFLDLLKLQGEASGASASASTHSQGVALVLGIALVLMGAVLPLAALYNHRAFVRSLPREDVPQLALPWLGSALVMGQALCGLLMAAYLAFA